MTEYYAARRSYEDKGTLTDVVVFEDGSEPSHTRIDFETEFDRSSGAFHFQYTQFHERFFSPVTGVIWRTHLGLAKVWLAVDQKAMAPVEETELSDAIGWLSGISLSTDYVVPSMLLPIREPPATPLPRYEVEGEDVVGDVRCTKLSAHQDSKFISLWIRSDNFALQKRFERDRVPPPSKKAIEERVAEEVPEQREETRARLSQMGGLTEETTIEWHPLFDRPIELARFDFTPPQRYGDR